MKHFGQGDSETYIPESVDELFKNGNEHYYIKDPDRPGDNIYGMRLFIEEVGIPDDMIVFDDGTQIFVSDGNTTLQIDSGGLGDFHLHGFDVIRVDNNTLKEKTSMQLTEIVKKILSEDTWGNNPSAGGSMAPGRSPTTTPPPASGNVKFHDLKKDYNAFVSEIEKQEEAAKKKLDTNLTSAFNGKKVTARASKGSVGQVEKDYSFSVASVDVVYLKDKFYIVLRGTDKSEYYINTEFKVKVDAAAPEAPTMGSTQPPPTPTQPAGVPAKGV